MNKLYVIAFFLLLSFHCKSQIIVFQDVNFKNYLTTINCIDTNDDGIPDSKLDTDNDSEISVTEINIPTNLYIVSGTYSSLYEISFFSNLDKLVISNTGLSSIKIRNSYLTDVQIHNNTSLERLSFDYVNNIENFDCSNNQLKSVIFYNSSISNFNCSFNQISSIKFVGLSYITNINCSHNLLTFLNISNVNNINCSYNNLNNLIAKNNGNLLLNTIDFNDNPDLQSICVDLQAIPLVNTNISNYGMSNVTVTSNCNTIIPCPTDVICFQDQRFEFHILTLDPLVDINFDGYIQFNEALSVTSLKLFSNGNIIGIKNFTNLQYLEIGSHQAHELDISNLSNLIDLKIHDTMSLNIANVSGLTSLTSIICENNYAGLGNFNLSDSTLLTTIICKNNGIYNLNISGLPNLTYLNLQGNSLQSIDLTGSPNLTYVNLTNNYINTINVSGLSSLVNLNLETNKLTNPDFSSLTSLTHLNVKKNLIENLNVSNLINLTHLYCDTNKITTLSIESLPNLRNLTCGSNYLTHLYLKNDNLTADFDTLYFNSNPNLDHICADIVDFPIIQSQILSYNQPYIILDSSCDVTNPCGTDIVCINDTNFKNKLFALGKDTNGDHHIQKTEALAVTSLDISTDSTTTTLNITDLTGIEFFTNLQNLNCSGNAITSLNLTNNTQLITLDCSNNKLTNLNIQGISPLETVNCYNNLLTTLDASSLINLKTLNCYSNFINSLNLLGSNSLLNIDCKYNLLVSLNVNGLSSLLTLDCSNNQSLTTCDFTPLTSLTSLKIFLTKIQIVNVNNSLSLEYLYARNITGINTLLLSNLVNLKCLDISGNSSLGSVDLTTLSKLTTLYCYSMTLSSLDVSGLKKLISVDASSSHFPVLDFGASQGLTTLSIYYSTIDYLNIKNNSGFSNFNNLFANVQYLCMDENENIGNNFHPLRNSYCHIEPGGNYNTVNGTVRLDLDNNCSSTDLPMNLVKIESSQVSGFNKTYTDSNGNYNFYPLGNSVTLSPKFPNNYFVAVPPSITRTFNTTTTVQTADFCVRPNGIHKDLEISVYSLGGVRPGFSTPFYIFYKNNGNTTQSGTINFNYNDTLLSLSSSNPAISSSTFNNLNWNFTNLKPFESRFIIVYLVGNTPTDTPPLNSGEILGFATTIPTTNDENPVDNTHTFNVGVTNSFDPNDKNVVEGSQIDITRVNNYLHYLVRFQNTGTADAVNVVVKDMIASNLDINTIETVGSSHSCKTLISNNNKVEFFFSNINLPPTSVDEIGSNGFIAFKIKPLSNSVIGDVFSNTANIYFDYNYPIITNTTETQVVNTLGAIDFEFSNNLIISPNPAKDDLSIISKNNIKINNIQIYNDLGQLILEISDTECIKKIDLTSMKSGVFFLKVKTDKGNSVSKFIKK